jgi:TsgA-like MFS transporter
LNVAAAPFLRTRFTWFGYLLLIFFGMGVATLGPIMPFIEPRLGLSKTLVGTHFAMLSAGNLLLGFLGERIAARVGNARLAWACIIIEVIAMIGLVLSNSLFMSLTFVFLMGLGAGGAALIGTASLTDAHPQHVTKVIAESTVAAALAIALTPLLIGTLEQIGLGWASFAGLAVILLAVTFLVFRAVSFPPALTANQTGESSNQPLPRQFWVFGAVIFLVVAIEWLTISWTPDFLKTVVGFSPGLAAALGSSFAWAVVFGRIAGRWIMNIIPPRRLLVGAYVVMLFLFPVYIYSPIPALTVGVLILLGLLAANQFPLALSAGMEAGGAQTNRASARISIFAGMAALTMPQIFGSLADWVGMQAAFTVVLVLIVVQISVTVVAGRMQR